MRRSPSNESFQSSPPMDASSLMRPLLPASARAQPMAAAMRQATQQQQQQQQHKPQTRQPGRAARLQAVGMYMCSAVPARYEHLLSQGHAHSHARTGSVTTAAFTPSNPATAAAADSNGSVGSTYADLLPSVGHSNPASTETPDSNVKARLDLDWRPVLGFWRESAPAVAATAACCVVYAYTAPSVIVWQYGLGIAAIFAALWWLLRALIKESMYRAYQKPAHELGDADSLFPVLDGIRVHVKARSGLSLHGPPKSASQTQSEGQPPGGVPRLQAQRQQRTTSAHSGSSLFGGATAGDVTNSQSAEAVGGALGMLPFVTALHCYHGFGANLFSFQPVQKLLAEALGGVVSAHDCPGFGLTERPIKLAHYYLSYNGKLGRLALDYAVQRALQQATTSTSVKAATSSVPTASTAYPGDLAEGGSSKVGAAGYLSPASPLSLASSSTSFSSSSAASADRSTSNGVRATSDQSSSNNAASLRPDRLRSFALPDDSLAISEDEADERVERPHAQQTSAATAGANVNYVPPTAATATTARVAVRRVLLGHSMGGLCAALEALAHPEEVEALVLVAPAVMALSSDVAAAADGTYGGPPLRLRPAPLPDTTNNHLSSSTHSSKSRITAQRFAAVAVSKESITSPTTLERSNSADPEASAGGDSPEGAAEGRVWKSMASADDGSSTNSSGSELQRAGIKPTPAPGANQGAKTRRPSLLSRGVTIVRALITSASISLTLLGLEIVRPLIFIVLRALVRNREFWVKGLSSAYHDPAALTPALVDSYRLPQLVRGWEAGMVRFVSARIVHMRYVRGVLAAAVKGSSGDAANAANAAGASAGAAAAGGVAAAAAGTAGSGGGSAGAAAAAAAAAAAGTAAAAEAEGPVPRRLAKAAMGELAGLPLRVLIVHGRQDRLVPASNSERLASLIPGCELLLYDNCGHMPHEEAPEMFVAHVAAFLAKLDAAQRQ